MTTFYNHFRSLIAICGILCISVSTNYGQGILDLSTNGPQKWASGAITRDFTGLGTPAVDVACSFVGGGHKFTTNPEGTPKSDPRGLCMSASFGSLDDDIVFCAIFSSPVTDLSFGIRGIDRDVRIALGNHYQDKVRVVALDAAGNGLTPEIRNNPAYTVITPGPEAGSRVIAGIRADPSDTSLTLVRYRTAPVKSIKIHLTPGTDGLGPDEVTLQRMCITYFAWASIVPVQLVYFKGKAVENTNQLSWATATEINSDFFGVQRSTNLKDFADIGKVKSAGDSRQRLDYQFTDESPLPGVNYYRLKQVDKDGTTDFSKTIAVNSSNTSTPFALFPNPSDGRSVQLQFDNVDLDGIKVFDIFGRTIPFEIQSSLGSSLTIKPMKKLNNGVYFISYSTFGQNKVSQKWIVNE